MVGCGGGVIVVVVVGGGPHPSNAFASALTTLGGNKPICPEE